MSEQPNREMRITPAAFKAMVDGGFENFIAAATPGGIERQEAEGQKAFVASTNIPIRLNGCTEEQLAQLGFVLGDAVDDLFRRCELPSGWHKEPTDHNMWSRVVDRQGRERVAIFYKAAFYDRRADASLCERYRRTMIEEPGGEYVYVVKDAETVVYRPDELGSDRGKALCDQWLLERYPDHRNPLAYWD